MNISHSYQPINTKNISSQKFNPYLLSNKENINNNLIPKYIPSESKISKQKREINNSNDVKKSLNLDISSFNNNSINPKKEIVPNLHRYSSFSSINSTMNGNNTNLNKNDNKKTLILDLDETLVHSAFTPFSRKSDLMLTINIDGENRLLYVLKRPYVDEFLYELSLIYEIIIFTASISEYANPLLDLLDKKKCIKYRLFREHCTYDNGIYIKDLKILDRKMNNMIIIDNNPLSYDNNVSNGIPILSWYEDTNDNELLKLIPILKYMSNNDVYDVRNIINKIVDRNRNEIDYIAINKIINENKSEKTKVNNERNNKLLISKNEYRKINKSEEPRTKMLNDININKEELKYNYDSGQTQLTNVKNNYSNKYGDENLKINILNTKYNIHNIYNYAFEQKHNINIDKKDPYGTRISIFSPEEYNILHNNKSYRFPFNRNMYNINSIEERKDDNSSKTIKPEIEHNNNYLLGKYRNNTYSNKAQSEKTLIAKKEEKKININKNNIENENSSRIFRAHSLVELTKKALHLPISKEENKNKNKNNEYDSVSKVLNRMKYFNNENTIIYNNYINENRHIDAYKSDRTLYNNMTQKKYFRNYLNESKRKEKNYENKILSLKQINSNNKIIQNYDFPNNEKDRLLKRINNDKINNFLGGKYLSKEKNYGNNNYLLNYAQKDNYINIIKKSIEQNKENFNMNLFNNSNINYSKNKNNTKSSDGEGYNFLNSHKISEIKNIMVNHKSVSYINNNKDNNMQNLKQSNLQRNQVYNANNLVKSSSYVQTNNAFNKIIDNFSLINNSNKENENNNNNNYVNNLNYRYDIDFVNN
jgi:Dullard-like phosphatase family protein